MSKKKQKDKKTKEQEYLEGWQRAKADYDNLQKETEKRMSDFRKYACEDILQQIFPLADYFKHAFEAMPKDADEQWAQGFKHIQDYYYKILNDNDVVEIETVGKQFDPELHEVVKEEESKEKENTIIKETQVGFTLNGKVVRPAKVIISKKK